MSADGRGVVGHAGARLVADVADVAEVTELTGLFGDVLAVLRQRQGGHDPGRVAVDLAVMLADGGEAISDLAVLRDQAQLFGPVASDRPRGDCCPTWTADCSTGSPRPALRRGKRRGRNASRPAAACPRPARPGRLCRAGAGHGRLDRDLPLRQGVRHPDLEALIRVPPAVLLLDNTREALSGMLREGRAGSNTTADHITVLGQALTQISDSHRHGTPIRTGRDRDGT